MLDEYEIQRAVAMFCNNPEWKQCYEEAPSKEAKRYRALNYYMSSLGLPDDLYNEACAQMHELEEKFTLEDWKYARRWAGHNPYWAMCDKKVKELEAKQKQEGQN